jgi:hypothetical protein
MPMYDFECHLGHHTEHFLPKFTERVQCGFVEHGPDGDYACFAEGEYRPSFWYSSSVQTAQRFSPVVIHRDASGNVRFPGHANAPVPEGFQKVELATIHDVRKFEKEISLQDSIKSEKFRQARAQFLDGQLEANRRAVDEIARGGTWQGTDENGRIVERRGISPRGMKILEQLREASKQKQAQGRSSANPEFFVEAFSQNASNREHHRDASTDWQRVRK